ncbi:MAG: hypothetical protein S0880_05835 [Actinomycetota bacterium]|nr:hypothetical protein [Actinomycetota bacterium]
MTDTLTEVPPAPEGPAVVEPDDEHADAIHGDVVVLSDREASDALVHGAVAGFFLVFVIAWGIGMGVGLGAGVAAAVAIWPAIVGGPFFGSLAFLVTALLHHEDAADTE